MTRPHNLFEDTAQHTNERVLSLAAGEGARIERIVSWGQASAPGFWYEQDDDEWVTVLTGRARLVLQDPQETLEMVPGDFVLIAARRRHRVDWTAPGEATVWLAVFLKHPTAPGASTLGVHSNS